MVSLVHWFQAFFFKPFSPSAILGARPIPPVFCYEASDPSPVLSLWRWEAVPVSSGRSGFFLFFPRESLGKPPGPFPFLGLFSWTGFLFFFFKYGSLVFFRWELVYLVIKRKKETLYL